MQDIHKTQPAAKKVGNVNISVVWVLLLSIWTWIVACMVLVIVVSFILLFVVIVVLVDIVVGMRPADAVVEIVVLGGKGQDGRWCFIC